MVEGVFTVLGIPVAVTTDLGWALEMLDQSFRRDGARPEALVELTGSPLPSRLAIQPGNPIFVRAHVLGEPDRGAYNYHDATKWLLRAALLVHERAGGLAVHGSAFVYDDICWLVIGETGRAGKTTLALAAIARGGTVVGDEYLVLRDGVIHGDPGFASYIRAPLRSGTLPADTPGTVTRLFASQIDQSVRLASMFPGSATGARAPDAVVVARVTPDVLDVRRVEPSVLRNRVELESLKHLAKLWLTQSEELADSDSSAAQTRLGRLGVNLAARSRLMDALLRRPCFYAVGAAAPDVILATLSEAMR